MKEYIEREALINMIEEKSNTRFDWSESVDIEDLIPAIKDMPAADVTPVKHGRWVFENKEGWFATCSNCGKSFRTQRPFIGSEFELNNPFCRHCGAKMDGGNE